MTTCGFRQFRGRESDAVLLRHPIIRLEGPSKGLSGWLPLLVYTFIAKATPFGSNRSPHLYLFEKKSFQFHSYICDGILLALHGAAVTEGIEEL